MSLTNKQQIMCYRPAVLHTLHRVGDQRLVQTAFLGISQNRWKTDFSEIFDGYFHRQNYPQCMSVEIKRSPVGVWFDESCRNWRYWRQSEWEIKPFHRFTLWYISNHEEGNTRETRELYSNRHTKNIFIHVSDDALCFRLL